MFRRVATWVLVVPLSFNGLWMVCAEAPPATGTAPQAQSAQQQSEADVPDCHKMCPLDEPAETAAVPSSAQTADMHSSKANHPGVMCIFAAGEGNGSIAAIAFAVAPPPAAIKLVYSPVYAVSATTVRVSYSSPSLAILKPPPKA